MRRREARDDAGEYILRMTSSMAEAQRGKAETLKALHRRGNPVILFNVWDAVSARIVEELGFPAIATTRARLSTTVLRILPSESLYRVSLIRTRVPNGAVRWT